MVILCVCDSADCAMETLFYQFIGRMNVSKNVRENVNKTALKIVLESGKTNTNSKPTVNGSAAYLGSHFQYMSDFQFLSIDWDPCMKNFTMFKLVFFLII